MAEYFKRTIGKLDDEMKRTRKDTPTSFNIEYTAPYAARIHEDLEMHHSNGQAKFLETALRQNEKQIRFIVSNSIKKKKGLRHGIKQAAEFALAKSNELVPVRTGQLKRSGRVVIVV